MKALDLIRELQALSDCLVQVRVVLPEYVNLMAVVKCVRYLGVEQRMDPETDVLLWSGEYEGDLMTGLALSSARVSEVVWEYADVVKLRRKRARKHPWVTITVLRRGL